MKLVWRIVLYSLVLTIPLALGLAAWQAARYSALVRVVDLVAVRQEEWIESNKRVITEIAVLSSSERIEQIAQYSLGLSKKRPEDVLQVKIRSKKTDTERLGRFY
jgi:cell division protein FtsL